jgi:hypothetical protein
MPKTKDEFRQEFSFPQKIVCNNKTAYESLTRAKANPPKQK